MQHGATLCGAPAHKSDARKLQPMRSNRDVYVPGSFSRLFTIGSLVLTDGLRVAGLSTVPSSNTVPRRTSLWGSGSVCVCVCVRCALLLHCRAVLAFGVRAMLASAQQDLFHIADFVPGASGKRPTEHVFSGRRKKQCVLMSRSMLALCSLPVPVRQKLISKS